MLATSLIGMAGLGYVLFARATVRTRILVARSNDTHSYTTWRFESRTRALAVVGLVAFVALAAWALAVGW